MRIKFANILKKTLALVLVFVMVFCTNSFDNLSRVYAEGSEGESTTSITASSSEETESSSIEASEKDGEDKENADEPSSEESENEESETNATEPEDETTTTTESSSIEFSSETSESEPGESETSESETSESETSETESNTSAVETTEAEASSEIVKEETATVSEIEEVNSLATKSEIKLDYDKLDSFAQLTYYDEDAAELTGDTIKLLKDIELKDTVSFKDNKNLDLSGHNIIGPNDSYALYIENNFTLFNDGEIVGKIEGKSSKYPTIYIKDANVELNGGFIYGASAQNNGDEFVENGGDAINSIDSSFKFTGALVYGGNGEESSETKGGNGGDGVKIISSKSSNTILINAGSLNGGNGANGLGDAKPKAGAALMVNKKIYNGQYFGYGLPGNFGGGNGGTALNIDTKEFKSANLTYEEELLNAGHAGYSVIIEKNDNVVESKVKQLDEHYALSRSGNGEEIFGTDAWQQSTYSLHYLDGKNYLTSLKNQLTTELCTVFSTTAYAETNLLKNYPDYVKNKLGKNIDDTYNVNTWNTNTNELNLAEMHFAMGLRTQPKDEFGNAGLSRNRRTQSGYDWASYGFSEPNITNYATTWRSFVLEDDKFKWTNSGSGSPLVGSVIDRNLLNSYNDKTVVNVKGATIHKASDFYSGSTFNRAAFVEALKKAVVDYAGVVLCIFTCGRTNNDRPGDYSMDGVNYGTDLSIFDAPSQLNRDLASLGGHAIYCIGWDDDVTFSTNLGNYTGAFICKNSWNEFALVPYDNNFGIYLYSGTPGTDTTPNRFMSFITMDFMPSYSEYENLYYYDTGVGAEVVYPTEDYYDAQVSKEPYGTYRAHVSYNSIVNTFKIRNNREKLKAVSFALEESGTYKVSLYKVTSLNNANQIAESMTDANKLAETTVNASYGMNTVPINEVNLDKGTFVAVKVENISLGVTCFGDAAIDANYPDTFTSDVSNYETTMVGRSFLTNPSTDIYEIVVGGNVYQKGTAEYNANINASFANLVITRCNNDYKAAAVNANLRVRLITNNYVKFNANGSGSYGGDAETYYYPTLKAAMTNIPYPSSVPSNKEFVKYNTKADRSGTTYNEASIYSLGVGKELELYAIYDDIFTLSFNANGGTGNMNPIRGRYGEVSTLIQVPACQFTRTGFTFAGWIDESGASFPVNQDITLSADKTLRATWKENEYAINYFLNEGEFTGEYVKTRKYTQDVDLPGLELVSRVGYIFDGWFDNEALSGKIVDRTNAANTDKVLTYYAKWSENKGGDGSRTGGGSGGGGGGGGGLPRQQANNVTKDTKLETVMASIPVSYASGTASTWTADAMGNWHLNMTDALGNVVEAKNTFVCLPQEVANTTGQVTTVLDFYYFDADGKMYTGWLRDTNNITYYFDTTIGNNQGKLTRGWASIDGGYYYFDPNGMLMTNGTTPDGYTVDANGKWVQQA